MMNRLGRILGFTLLLGFSAIADDRADREKLVGSWQLQDHPGESPATGWTFASSGANLQVTQLDGDKILAKFQCATDGSPREIKTGGKKAMMSMWYNGAKLVQMESKGSDVVKRRFGVLPQTDVMEMEVIPIVPGGKTETFRFQRVQVSAQGK
jgi:hypothetical protein